MHLPSRLMHTTRMVPAIPIGSAIDRGSLVLRAELPARVEAVNRAASARRDQPILVLCVESLESQARLDEAATHTQSTRFTLVLHCTLRVRMQDIPEMNGSRRHSHREAIGQKKSQRRFPHRVQVLRREGQKQS